MCVNAIFASQSPLLLLTYLPLPDLSRVWDTPVGPRLSAGRKAKNNHYTSVTMSGTNQRNSTHSPIALYSLHTSQICQNRKIISGHEITTEKQS